MTVPAPPTLTPAPSPAPTRADPANFNVRADAYHSWLPPHVNTELPAIILWMQDRANEIAIQADDTLEASSTATTAAAAAAAAPTTSATSTTSLTIGDGSKTFTVQTGKSFVSGQFVIVASQANPSNFMFGQITSYTSSTGSMTVDVQLTEGSGTAADWVIGLSPPVSAFAPTYQEFTSSGIWTKPAGATMVYIEAIGAGGSGAGVISNSSISNLPGGGGGEFASKILRASDVGTTEVITVGAGGAGGSFTGTFLGGGNGVGGGDSSFGAHIDANGGSGGSGGGKTSYSTPYFQGNATVLGSKFGGAAAGTALAAAGTRTGGVSQYAGNGGTSVTTSNTNNTGATAGSYPGGGGGSAAISNAGSPRTATWAAGADGRVRVWCW